MLLKKEKLFDFSKHVAEIRVCTDRAYFINLADLHYGLNERKLVKAAVEFMLSIPNLFIGIGGDAGNGASKISKGNTKEEWASGDEQLYAIKEDFQPLVDAGRLLYIIDGNHWAGRYKEQVGFCPEQTLAYLFGRPDLYKGEEAILYFNVNKNCYVHFAQHASGKAEDKFAWVSADVTWREHTHAYYKKEKLVVEHNKFAKKPIIKEVLEIFSGSWQVMPNYTKTGGFRPVKPGCFIVEMSGIKDDWGMYAWKDEELYHMIKNGYKVN